MAALSPADRETAIDALIRDHPDARVVAIARSALAVPTPADLPTAGRPGIDGIASMLDVVHPSNAKKLIDAWELMKVAGEASVTVRAWHDRTHTMDLRFVDVTERYGVIVCVVTGYVDAGLPPPPTRLLPRTSAIRMDELSYIIGVDESAGAILGWSAEELIGQRSQDLVHPDDEEYAVGGWMWMLSRPGSSAQIRLRHRHRDGSWRWLEITNHNNLAVPGDPHIRADVVDVTAEIEAVNALRTNERMLLRLAEALPIGVLYIEADRRISYRNARVAAIAGVGSAPDIDAQLAYLVPASASVVATALDAAFSCGEDADIEVAFQVPGGRLRRCLMSLRPVTNQDAAVVGAITCLTDITDDVNHREDLERRVRYDPLTSCLNHPSILAEVQRRLEDPRPGQWTVVVFIDLDEFKAANDRYGHPEGDRLLKHVAVQLWAVAGEDGLVGRVGGDEFLMVVRAPADPRTLSVLAADVTMALHAPIVLGGELIQPRGSVGLAYAAGIGPEVADAAQLIAHADSAMYRCKRQGGGIPVIA